jgi:glyoxylase-like metal-dependent hydrolase (beta-lactamase superfamily II)
MDIQVQVIDLGFVNAFLVGAGDGYVLIDTGVGQQWASLENALLKAGCLPGKLKLVLITHGDFDHTGNCSQLQKKYQAKIAMHPGDVAMVKTGVVPERQTRGWAIRLMMSAAKLFSPSRSFATFEPDVLLEDGQSLADYGLAAKVIHTPGHTKGEIALLTEAGQLFVGDTVANRGRPSGAPFVDDFEQLRASLAVLKSLPATTVYPGHGKPFAGEALKAVVV